MRKAANVDGNQRPIVAALRLAGATVQHLVQLGGGVPDLLVGYRRRTFLLEVKSAEGELEDSQVEWHREWRGLPVDVVRTPLQALQAVGAVRRGP